MARLWSAIIRVVVVFRVVHAEVIDFPVVEVDDSVVSQNILRRKITVGNFRKRASQDSFEAKLEDSEENTGSLQAPSKACGDSNCEPTRHSSSSSSSSSSSPTPSPNLNRSPNPSPSPDPSRNPMLADGLNAKKRQPVSSNIEITGDVKLMRRDASTWLPDLVDHWDVELWRKSQQSGSDWNLAPYIFWSKPSSSWVCNRTHSKSLGYEPPEAGNPEDVALSRFLSTMERLAVPLVLAGGSLPAFLAECKLSAFLSSDGLEFITFDRFLKGRVDALLGASGCLADGVCLRGPTGGDTSGVGRRLDFSLDGPGQKAFTLSLLIAEELPGEYRWTTWFGAKCSGPQPPTFLPALDEASGGRFFIAATASIEAKLHRGPSWWRKYNGWVEPDSRRHFLGCKFAGDASRDTGHPRQALQLAERQEMSWDQSLAVLEQRHQEASARPQKSGSEGPFACSCVDPPEKPAPSKHDPVKDFSELRIQLRPWYMEFLQRWRDDVSRTLELDWAGAPGRPGVLEPYLVWDHKEKAFVCNPKGQTTQTKDKAQEDMSRALSGAVNRTLNLMEQKQLPLVLNSGSLLSFVRGCDLGTDDIDFITFDRFIGELPALQQNVKHWDLPGSGVKGIKLGDVWWKPRSPGHQFDFVVDMEDQYPGVKFPNGGAKVDVFVAGELPEEYARGITINKHAYPCGAPRPPMFLPAKHPSGSHFFIPATALLELELFYGPYWREPYDPNYGEAWHWSKSLRHFFGCESGVGASMPASMRDAAWDGPLASLDE